MAFRMPQKKIIQPNNNIIQINGSNIEFVENCMFLGITINNKLNWNSHINKVTNKISKTVGIYIYNSVLTCRQNIINSSASAPLNATKIAAKKDSDVGVCMFGPEL